MINIAPESPYTLYNLEECEIAYWGKYYTSNNPLKSIATNLAGALVCAVPEVDILAMNRVIGLGLREEIHAGHIEEIIAFYKKAGVKRFFLQLCAPIIDNGLRKILLNNGFKFGNNWVKLAKKAEGFQPPIHKKLRVVQIDKFQAQTYAELLFNSFDWGEEKLIDWLASVVGNPGYAHYLTYLDNIPIAAAAMHLNGKYASMAFAGTLPTYRGMGAQTLLIKHRISDAITKGCSYLVAETAEEKFGKQVYTYRNLIKTGFQPLYLRENWIYEFKNQNY